MGEPSTARALQVVARALGRQARDHARSGDVTPQQAEAIQVLGERGAMSTSSLAERLGIDPSTASRNLAGLERAGLIVRRRGSADGRQTDVRLSPRGRRVAEAIGAAWTKAHGALLEGAPRVERQRLVEVLALLARLLDAGP